MRRPLKCAKKKRSSYACLIVKTIFYLQFYLIGNGQLCSKGKNCNFNNSYEVRAFW